MSGDLIVVDALSRTLAQLTDLGEVKELRDKAESIQLYLKRAGAGLEAQNCGAEVKLRAERKLGELLRDTVQHQGGRKRTGDDSGHLPEGIDRNQSHRWQLMASVPPRDFERYLRDTRAQQQEITSSAVLAIAQRPKRLRELDKEALEALSEEELETLAKELEAKAKEELERQKAREQKPAKSAPPADSPAAQDIRRALAHIEEATSIFRALGSQVRGTKPILKLLSESRRRAGKLAAV